MLQNYLKIAFRNFWRNKSFTFINVLGLAIGMASCLLITLYVVNELSYDRYNEKADQLYRITFRGKVQGGEIKEANVMPPVAQALRQDYPEVKEVTRIRTAGKPAITYGNKSFREDALAYVDPNFFEVFTLPLREGNAKQVLEQPNTVVITREVASKYFGNENPIGKILTLKDRNTAFTVTGMIEKVPVNSHFHFGMFASMRGLPEASEPSWVTSNFYTYLVLPKGYDAGKLEKKLPQLVDKYIGPQLMQALGLSLSQFREQGNSLAFKLQHVTDIHLHSDLTGDMEAYGDIRYVYIFTAVAIFMLLIACINFMNLSTAAASKRAKEVGIRKVLGSLRIYLVRQFLVESLLLTLVALLIAIVLVKWALPVFNNLAGEDLSDQLNTNPWIWLELVLFGLLTGLIAGSYPAFFLSSFKPILVLKSKFSAGSNRKLRSGLVVFQFFISISLMVGTAVVYRQLYYINHKELGYEKEQVLVIDNSWMLGAGQQAFKQKIEQIPAIKAVTSSSFLPAGASNTNNFFLTPDSSSTSMAKTVRYEVDENYLDVLGMKLVAGRNFSPRFPTDSSGIIINETAARLFGWGKEAIGHQLTHAENDGRRTPYHVIGVVKDFHFRSLHEMIAPLVMTLNPGNGALVMKAATSDLTGLLNAVRGEWDKFHAEAPLAFSFLDDRYRSTYKAEATIGRILGIFAGLTIFVACLGLFGLATFTAEQRTKEIGIRKVLGASVSGIVSLLSKDFLKLVAIAFVVAVPVAWMVLDRWLQDFAYRVRISWWLFAAAAVVAAIITLLTIGLQSFRAARANPVNSLRSGD